MTIPFSVHPGEGRDPGVFEVFPLIARASEKTWVPAFAGMSGF